MNARRVTVVFLLATIGCMEQHPTTSTVTAPVPPQPAVPANTTPPSQPEKKSDDQGSSSDKTPVGKSDPDTSGLGEPSQRLLPE